MKTIESKIEPSTCINKVKVMTHLTFTEEEIHCFNCSGKDEYCDNYKSIKNSGERFSYLNLYVK